MKAWDLIKIIKITPVFIVILVYIYVVNENKELHFHKCIPRYIYNI